MTPEVDCVPIRLPRKTAIRLTEPPAAFVDRLHHLLELNGDGLLTSAQRADVELLVDIGQIGHLIGLGLLASGEK